MAKRSHTSNHTYMYVYTRDTTWNRFACAVDTRLQSTDVQLVHTNQGVQC